MFFSGFLLGLSYFLLLEVVQFSDRIYANEFVLHTFFFTSLRYQLVTLVRLVIWKTGGHIGFSLASARHVSELVSLNLYRARSIRRDILHEYLSHIVHFIFSARIYLRVAPKRLSAIRRRRLCYFRPSALSGRPVCFRSSVARGK